MRHTAIEVIFLRILDASRLFPSVYTLFVYICTHVVSVLSIVVLFAFERSAGISELLLDTSRGRMRLFFDAVLAGGLHERSPPIDAHVCMHVHVDFAFNVLWALAQHLVVVTYGGVVV